MQLKMKNRHIVRFGLAVAVSCGLLWSCNTNKMMKNSECQILTFEIEEYPDVRIDRGDPYVIIHMPEQVSDLNMTPVFTVSEGASVPNEATRSGVKRDFGDGAKITVVSEDNLFLSTYQISVTYPWSRLDFNTEVLPQQSERYGGNFSFSFADFPGQAAPASQPVKWDGFALSNRTAPDLSTPPADLLSWQFFPSQSSGRGNMLLAHLGYDPENAVEVSFERPINPDSLTFVPSALTAYCMANGYTDENGRQVEAMNMQDKDYMILVVEGYDEQGECVGAKEEYVANFSLPERPYIRQGWQTLKLKATKLKNVKKLRLYLRGQREAFYPVFAIDKISYQAQPQPTAQDQN